MRGGQTDPVSEMQLTQPMVRLSYSLSGPVTSLAAANATVKAGPVAMPAKVGPMKAMRLLGIEQMMREPNIPRPAITISFLGCFEWSYSRPPQSEVSTGRMTTIAVTSPASSGGSPSSVWR